MGGFSGMMQNAMSRLPPNLQHYSGGPAYPGMQRNVNTGVNGMGGGISQSMQQNRQQSWPGFGIGGRPGFGGKGGMSYGMPASPWGGSHAFGGGRYGPGSYSSPGAMPFGGGSGMHGPMPWGPQAGGYNMLAQNMGLPYGMLGNFGAQQRQQQQFGGGGPPNDGRRYYPGTDIAMRQYENGRFGVDPISLLIGNRRTFR